METLKVYKKEWLKGLKIIDRPHGKIELTVANNVTEKNRINATEPGKSDKYIVTFKAIATDQKERLYSLFKERNEVPFEELDGLFLTASIWCDGGVDPQLPMKGEAMFASIDFVDNKEKTAKLLRITNTKVKPAEHTSEFDFDSFFADQVTAATEAGTIDRRDIVQQQ